MALGAGGSSPLAHPKDIRPVIETGRLHFVRVARERDSPCEIEKGSPSTGSGPRAKSKGRSEPDATERVRPCSHDLDKVEGSGSATGCLFRALGRLGMSQGSAPLQSSRAGA